MFPSKSQAPLIPSSQVQSLHELFADVAGELGLLLQCDCGYRIVEKQTREVIP
jgi:hypothetical protein